MDKYQPATDLIDFDRHHLWHPYTSMTNPLPTYLVESAKGVEITLHDGTVLIDGMASWWCAIHGYNQPILNAALNSQIERMSHIMFGGITHQPAIKLAQQLLTLTPKPLNKIFLADSGSVAVEVAIKMALQYQRAQGKGRKTKIAALRGGYHGDTLGAMSVCDPVNGMHQLFADVLPQQIFFPRPQSRFGDALLDVDKRAAEALFEKYQDDIAAFIVEPVVQGAGGMWFYSPDYLKLLRQLCDHYGVLLVADEIATGFGRSGKLFACEYAEVVPDILCIGKSLTGGYMSLAASITSETIANGISKEGGVLMHGPTFMGNPLACAVANASIQLLLTSNWHESVMSMEEVLRAGLLPLCQHSMVSDIRVLGAIGVVECRQPVNVGVAQQHFVSAGVWIRPFGKLIYLMPPYIIEPQQIKMLCDAIASVLDIENAFTS